MKKELLDLVGKNFSITNEKLDRIDQFLECLEDNNVFNNLDEILSWLEMIKKNLDAKVKQINLSDVDENWLHDEKTGDLVHSTGGYFKVIGVDTRTSIRESGKGWSQPMIDQGTEASVVGLLCKEFDNIRHYLVEAKFEPGNYDKVILSPTLQVTYDNLKKMHSGRKPHFSEYFHEIDPESDINVHFEHWYPEDGGRFYLKRVKNMLVRVGSNHEFKIPDNFIWVTMYQLKMLLKRDNLINPHLRSIISYL